MSVGSIVIACWLSHVFTCVFHNKHQNSSAVQCSVCSAHTAAAGGGGWWWWGVDADVSWGSSIDYPAALAGFVDYISVSSGKSSRISVCLEGKTRVLKLRVQSERVKNTSNTSSWNSTWAESLLPDEH